jgi:hypothetical protein
VSRNLRRRKPLKRNSMPDITMCEGKDCPLKEDCYRYTAKPNEYRQSYFVNPPYNEEKKECDHYWKTDD